MSLDPITVGEQWVREAFDFADAAPDPTPEELRRAIAEANGKVVYFVQSGEGGPIKIGVTRRTHIEKRLLALQTGNPYPLRLLGWTFGNEKLERTLHRLFGHLRMQGEWFWPHPQLESVACNNGESELAKYIPHGTTDQAHSERPNQADEGTR